MSAAKKLKTGIKNLSSIDPDFAEYLKKEDSSLLDFDPSDDEGDSGSEELEEASDAEMSSEEEKENDEEEEKEAEESEEEEENNIKKPKKSKKLIKIDLEMTKEWNNLLNTDLPSALKEISLASRAAVSFTSSKKLEEEKDDKYMVESYEVYKAVLNICVLDVVPSIYTYLNILPDNNDPVQTNNTQEKQGKKSKKKKKQSNKENINKEVASKAVELNKEGGIEGLDVVPFERVIVASKSKKWIKIKPFIKIYATNLIELLSLVSSETETLMSMLKHLHQLIPFCCPLLKLLKPLIKKLVEYWSQGEKLIRLMAFRSLIRMVSYLDDKLLKFAFTNMYLSFVKHSRFTNQHTINYIRFMQSSLVQVLSLKPQQAYRSSFYFIQQLAKHMHNALKLQKKQTHQVINNWQFVQSLALWGSFIGRHPTHPLITTFIHPLVEIVLATVRMNPAPVYIPLRLFCARVLVTLSETTNKFIPVLNIITEPLETSLFHKETKQTKMKNCVISCCLRMNKSELHEKAFLDAAMDELVELLLQYATHYSCNIAFPELFMPTIMQLKRFLKVSKAASHKKKVKGVLDVLSQRCSEVEKLRRRDAVDLTQADSLSALESKWQQDGQKNVVASLHDSVVQAKIKQLQVLMSNQNKFGPDKVPSMEKAPIKSKATDEEKQDFKDLFNFGDDDDDDDDERFMLKKDAEAKKSSKKDDGDDQMNGIEDDDSDVDYDDNSDIDEDDSEVGDEDTDDDDQPDVVEDLKLSEFADDDEN